MEAPRVSRRKRTALTLETDSFYSGKEARSIKGAGRLVGER